MRSLVLFLALFVAVLGGCHRRDDRFFFAVPWPGDYNANGHSDVLIGAPFDDAAGPPGSQRGRVYLHAGAFGGPGTLPTVIYNGTEDGGTFGAAVAAIGDYDGDGFPDFAVGAPNESVAVPGDQRGKVYIFLGGSSFPTAPTIVLSGTEDNGHFGAAVGRAGDIDGRGRDMLIVGAPDESGGGTKRGRAYVFKWKAGILPILTLNGFEDGSKFGAAVDTAGDMDGDGFLDIAVGAPLENGGGTFGGRVYVYFGGSSPSAVPGLTLTGPVVGGQFGASVAGILDFNFDGFDDLAVGAPLDSTGGAGAGRAFVFFGGAVPNATPDVTITGAAGSHLGAMVARIGDINAGGAPDLLVGAPLDDGGGAPGSERGRAFIFFGGTSADNVADVLISGSVDGGHFGSSGFSGGDATGDGIRDLVIGAPDDSTNGAGSGRAFFFPGATSMGTIPTRIFEGAKQAGAKFGTAVQ